MDKKNIVKICFLVAIIASSIASFPIGALGASPTLYFDIPKENLRTGAEIGANVLIRTPLPTNAYDILVRYSSDILELTGFDDSNSIIDIWQGQPTVFESGRIRINGGSLKPFQGEAGKIITIRFRAIATGTASLFFENAYVYLANGKGTKVNADHKSTKFTVSSLETPITASSSARQDTSPPEITYFTLLSDPFNPNQKLLSFLTKDSGSGIERNEIREKRWFSWSNWRDAINPTAIDEGVWAIDFRAVDNSGNATERRIRAWDRFAKNFAPALVFMAIVPMLVYLFTKQRRR